VVVATLALAAAVLPAAASAATIVVTDTSDTQSFDHSGCDIREAISASNNNANFGDCNGDSAGADTIVLEGGKTYQTDNIGPLDDDNTAGDLDITGTVTITTNGTGVATIQGNVPRMPTQRDRVLQIFGTSGGVTLDDIRVTGGAVGNGTGGGGIFTSAPLTLNDSEVTGNSAGVVGGTANFGGGGIRVNDANLTLNRSTVADNILKANAGLDTARGGGIVFFSVSDTNLNATNSTISGNVVNSNGTTDNPSYAGGILWEGFSDGRMNLTNDTISNNSATGGAGNEVGGGIVIFGLNNGKVTTTLTNTILAGNQAPSEADCHQVYPTDDWNSGGNNVIGDSACGHIGGSNDAFGANPLLGTLSNYGGPTRTMTLNPGSPAINRGGACPETDQRGFFRAPAAPCDAGSFELNASATAPAPPASGAPAAPKCKKKKKHKRSAVAAGKCKKKKKKR
jgi:hypothetical protein